MNNKIKIQVLSFHPSDINDKFIYNNLGTKLNGLIDIDESSLIDVFDIILLNDYNMQVIKNKSEVKYLIFIDKDYFRQR